MTEAIKAGDYLCIYCEDGENPRPCVIEELKTGRDPPLGREKLLKFLKDFDARQRNLNSA